MNTEQPLKLADYLDDKPDSDGHCRQAAAELRRLHAEIEALREALKEARKIIRASSSRNLAKDWDQRATAALARAGGKT